MRSYLYTSLLLLIVAGSSWAAFGPAGIFLFALIGILAALLNQSKTIVRALLYFAAILLVIALLLPAISCARESARRMQCSNQIKMIALALHNYHVKYKSFPPAYVADKNGKPMHSWRVLILPFIEGQQLYDKYRFDEPWDGPNNSKLLDERPRGYGCLSDELVHDGPTKYTNYFAVVGPNAAWQGEKPRSLDDANLRGKDDSTVLVVESVNAHVPWTEPKDMALDASDVTSPATSQVVSSRHEREADDYFHHDAPMANAAIVNGSVRPLPAGIRADSPLLRIGGCTDEVLSGFWNSQFNWPHAIGLPVWLISVVLLLIQAVRSRKARREVATSCT